MPKAIRPIAVAVATLIMGAAGNLFAAGYSLPEQGATATAMGGGGTASAEGPEAIRRNPAALTRVKDSALAVGVTLVAPSRSLANNSAGGVSEGSDGDFTVPALFASIPPGVERVVIGLGVSSPHRYACDWSPTGSTRYAGYHVRIGAVAVSPAIAYEPVRGLSLGYSVSYITGEAALGRKFPGTLLDPALTGDGDISFAGDGTAFGWSAGLLWRIADGLVVGVSHRSASTLGVKGTANYTLPAGGDGDIRADAAMELPLPSVTSVGISLRPADPLQVTVDLDRTGWSAFDNLLLEVDSRYAGTPTGRLVRDTAEPQRWRDTWTVRAGAEYRPIPSLAVRFGAFYDQSPVPDETLGPLFPDADRIGLSTGLGYAAGKLSVGIGYLALLVADREVVNDAIPSPGTDSYSGSTHVLGITASWGF
jgi:long-chain fatty acid transport protein